VITPTTAKYDLDSNKPTYHYQYHYQVLQYLYCIKLQIQLIIYPTASFLDSLNNEGGIGSVNCHFILIG
jgi:hypothetical protein